MYDLSAFRNDAGQPFAMQTLADERDSGRTVSGMSKSAQRFILELLTPTNDVAQEDIGCDFVTRLQSSGFSSESDVFVAFASSCGQAISRVQGAELSSDPDSERLAKVTIVSLTIGDGVLSLSLRLTNRAGTFENIDVPLEFLI